MRRVVVVISAVTLAIFGYLIYQYKVQKTELQQLQGYQDVINAKGELIYNAAQNWKKPIQVDLNTSELDGDYKIMADFMLNFIVESAEARNTYVRELKDKKWDRFLDIKRLESDKKNNYQDTEVMLISVKEVMQRYQDVIEQHNEQGLKEVKKLKVNQRFRRYLRESFNETLKQNNQQHLLDYEKENFENAQKLFELLKKNEWVGRNNMFLFKSDAVAKEFNDIFKAMIEVDNKIKNVRNYNKHAIEAKL
jgi:hypothetical protein